MLPPFVRCLTAALPASMEQLSDWLQKRDSHAIMELSYLEVGLGPQSIHMQFGDGGAAYTLLVRDSLRCKRFFGLLTGMFGMGVWGGGIRTACSTICVLHDAHFCPLPSPPPRRRSASRPERSRLRGKAFIGGGGAGVRDWNVWGNMENESDNKERGGKNTLAPAEKFLCSCAQCRVLFL